jgi:group I intron endonuclease
LIEKATLRDRPIVYESHHIIPKSLGGKNNRENISFLTPREHFIAHALLTKMVTEKIHKRSMAYAFARMKVSNNISGYSRIGNGKLYESMRKSLRSLYSGENNPFFDDHRFAGQNNPFYGKTHSEEFKQKLRQQKKRLGEENRFYGKTHTDQTKSVISEKQREPVTIIFEDGKATNFNKRGDIGSALGISKAMGIQLCTIKRHLWSKYKIKEILYEDNINQTDTI